MPNGIWNQKEIVGGPTIYENVEVEGNKYANLSSFWGGAVVVWQGSSFKDVGSTYQNNGLSIFQPKPENKEEADKIKYAESERGGAIFNGFSRDPQSFLPSQTIVISTLFKENATVNLGGAVYNDSGSSFISQDNRYEKNYSQAFGGAIFNGIARTDQTDQEVRATVTLLGENKFIGNNATYHAGALLNAGVLVDGKDSITTFEGNETGLFGGAFANMGNFVELSSNPQYVVLGNLCKTEANFLGTVIFKNNTSLGIQNDLRGGGAVANLAWGSIEKETLLTFGGVTIFESNKALGNNGSGGAILNQDAELKLIGNQVFNGNVATVYGGAIFNFPGWGESKTIIGGESLFTENSALWGGAIYNQSVLAIEGKQTFLGNTAKNDNGEGQGGAIAMYSQGAKTNIKGEVSFIGNHARNGGAIYNQDGSLEVIGETLFEANSSSYRGGAIFNNSSVKFGEGTRIFRENSSDGSGGAIYNLNTGNITFGGNNIFESNTANGVANDIFNNGQIDFGSENNPHSITVLNGGVTGAGTMSLNSGRLVLGSGAQIHQKSFTAKAGTMTTVVLSDAHHVHDKNVAHFDELADENGTGHDKVATAVGNNGFGIHTTGQMTLEKGAILNIVSDNIQAGHTYLVAYNEAEPEAVAKMVRAADTSVVINPAGFEHDETSWKGENLISSNPLVKLERVEGDNTNGYILVTSKNSNSISIIEDLAGLDQVYFSWLSDLEDLRQRLGEVRLGADNGIWTKVSYARYRASGLGDGKVKSTDYSIHVGADGTLYKNNGHKFFAGFSFKGGHTDMKAARAAGTGDLNHYTWKLYGTYVHEKGSYADIVASVGTFNNRFRGYHDSWTGQVHGDVNNWGAGISGEVGHQFRFLEESAGSFWFAEPQIQLSYFRVKGKNYETSNAIHVEQKSVNFLTGRVGVSAGKQFAYGADKKRYLQLSAKAGLIHEFAGDQKLRLNEKKLSADGKKNLFYYGADMDWQFADNHKLYLKVDRATGSGYRKDIQIQGGYRYSF